MHCTLYTARCTLHAARCTLHAARCTLHTAHCTLQDWVSLIFGENDEKVTENRKKIGQNAKEGKEKDEKNDAEEFLDQFQFFPKKVKPFTHT